MDRAGGAAPAAELERLRFLREVTDLEARYRAQTDARLYAAPMSVAQVQRLPLDQDAAERVDAFVARLGVCKMA